MWINLQYIKPRGKKLATKGHMLYNTIYAALPEKIGTESRSVITLGWNGKIQYK